MQYKQKFLTSGQVAKRFKLPLVTILDWDKKGYFKKVTRTNGGWRVFDKAEVEEFSKKLKRTVKTRLIDK